MADRNGNIGIRTGDTIIHCNRQFTIVHICIEECMDGMVLMVRAFDPEMADREQQKAISVDQTKNRVLDIIKKMTEGGGGGALGGIRD